MNRGGDLPVFSQPHHYLRHRLKIPGLFIEHIFFPSLFNIESNSLTYRSEVMDFCMPEIMAKLQAKKINKWHIAISHVYGSSGLFWWSYHCRRKAGKIYLPLQFSVQCNPPLQMELREASPPQWGRRASPPSHQQPPPLGHGEIQGWMGSIFSK